MKFTLSWLKDHLDTSAPVEKISETLSSIGLEVESIEDKAKALAPFKVAEILEAEKHPNADKLRVCKVNTGTETLQIVCGAANARAGIKVILAPIGVTIPANGLVIKKSNIRSVESNGMLCSAEELGLSEESEGIVELPSSFKIGASYAEEAKLNDPVFEIAITPNRGDCLGVRGVARDLAAAGLGTLKEFEATKVPGKFPSPIKVFIENEKIAPFYVGRFFKNIKNPESPEWLKSRLQAIGLKPISALVDITNYITFDLGRPLHVYDAKKLEGNINICSGKNEKLLALNDKEYNLDTEIPVIADEKKAVAIGGIIGGKETGVSESTNEIFLEVALFDPVSIAKAGRKLQIDSDARYRFERSVDSGFLIDGAEIATRMILEICGGETSELVTAGKEPENKKIINFNYSKIKTFGGLNLDEEKAIKILNKLGFQVNKSRNLEVKIPSWRNDVSIEVDLIEEILRINGYDNIPLNSLPSDNYIAKSSQTAQQKFIASARRILAGNRGLIEAVTFSFMHAKDAEKFAVVPASLKLLNPISAELDSMRPSIIPNLINAAKNNINRGINNISLFEIGPVFGEKWNGQQQVVAAGIRTGENAEKNHYKEQRKFDFFDVKADVFAVFSMIMNPEKMTITREVPKYYYPGKSGAIMLGKNILAYFGELHPSVIKNFDIKTNISAFEIFVENIPLPKEKKKTSKGKLEISNFQAVERDFAFIIDNKFTAEEIIKTISKIDKDLIANVNIFDVYSGKGIEEGKKSIALSVHLQPKDKTLTDAEINEISTKIIDAVKTTLGGTLRA